MVWVALAACLILWSGEAGGHEIRPPIATVEVDRDGAVEVLLTLNLEAAIAGIGSQHEDTSASPAAPTYDRLRALDPAALETEFERFAPDLLARVALETDAGPVPLAIDRVAIPEVGDLGLARISELRLAGAAPPGATRLAWIADPRLGDSVVRFREAGSGEVLAAEFVGAGETSAPVAISAPAPRDALAVVADYLEVGFVHIVPKGLDHILFVVGLFLLSTRLGALLWQVTAFTLAHTVTLALSSIGVIQLSPAIVEPLIAASIVYVAVENMVTDRLHAWRPLIVFGFGLLHGLGFAGVLQEIGPAPGRFVLSLLAFNLGVELGQLAVIALCLLLVGWTANRPWRRQAVVVPASLVIAVIAAYWFFERLGLA